jgi:hypothetical protein
VWHASKSALQAHLVVPRRWGRPGLGRRGTSDVTARESGCLEGRGGRDLRRPPHDPSHQASQGSGDAKLEGGPRMHPQKEGQAREKQSAHPVLPAPAGAEQTNKITDPS